MGDGCCVGGSVVWWYGRGELDIGVRVAMRVYEHNRSLVELLGSKLCNHVHPMSKRPSLCARFLVVVSS